MSDFKKRFFINLGIGGGSVLVILFFTFFIGSRLSARAVSIQALKQEIGERNAAIQSLAVLKQEATRAVALRRPLEELFPSQDDLVVNFKKDMSALAKKGNLKFTFAFGEPQSGSVSKAGSIAFTMSATGAFNSLLAFLQDIESSRYVTALGPIEFAASGKEWKISASGKVFSQPIIAPASAGEETQNNL